MASTLVDLAIMTVSSAFGTNTTIPLGAAATINGTLYLSFANAGATGGQQVSYSILDTNNSEIGTATYTSSNTTLTGRTPTKSTNAGAAISASSAALILATVRGEDLNSFIVAGQLLGTATNDTANSGNVGELISSVILSSQAVSLTTGTAKDITSISLSAGDWQLYGNVVFAPGSGAQQTAVIAWTSSQSATLPSIPNNGAYEQLTITFNVGSGPVMSAGSQRVSLSSSATYFLGALSNFSSTCTAYGFMGARRAR